MYPLRRIIFFKYLTYTLLGILVFYLFKIQIIEGVYYRKRSENNRIRLIPIKATRGRIFDRYNRVLANNQPSFNLYVIPKDLYLESCEELSEIITIPPHIIKEKVENSPHPSFVPIILNTPESPSPHLTTDLIPTS